MFSMNQIIFSLVLCLLMQMVLSQESPDLAEDYIDEDLPESSAEEEQLPPPKAVNDTKDSSQKSNFADDRFTKLFKPRNRINIQNKPSPFLPKFAYKAKPTLPSFIKRTQPFIRVNLSTVAPVQNQRFNQRATSTSTQRTTTRTPSRIGNTNNNRRNQINSGNNRLTSTTPNPFTTDSSSRRRYGAGNRRFNVNATIPATTSRPRRN